MAGKNADFINGSAPQCDDTWLDIHTNELKNAIQTSGQVISDVDNFQLSKAMANYAAVSTFYTDSGTANTYVLTPIGVLKTPDAYYNGMLARYRPLANNTGASTINVNSLGVKDIKKADGVTDPAAGEILTTRDTEVRYDGTVFRISTQTVLSATTSIAGSSLLPSQIIISNNVTDIVNDIDFAAGVFQFSDGSGQAAAGAKTKRLDAAWVAGTNQGGLDTGSKAVSTWYHCYAIYNPTSSLADAIFSTNATTPTLPSGYTKYKRVGSIRTDASGNIFTFNQYKNTFIFSVPKNDISATNTTIATPRTLSVPLGIKTRALIYVRFSSASLAGGNSGLISSLDTADTNPSVINNMESVDDSSYYFAHTSDHQVITDTSSQVRTRATAASGNITIRTYGWEDYQL